MYYDEKQKRKHRSRNEMRLIYISIGILLTIFVCGGCAYTFLALTWGNPYSMCFGNPFPSNEDVEQGAYFEFPSSADEIEYDADTTGNGCKGYVKFRIEADDLEVFQQSTLVTSFESIPLDGNRFELYSQKMNWIRPEKSLTGGGYSLIDGYLEQWVVIDIGDETHYIVYIITHKDYL